MKNIVEAISTVLLAMVYWTVLWLPALLIPRQASRVTVLGRDEGKLVDNAKYAYVGCNQDVLEVAFVTSSKEVVAQLQEAGCRAYRYPGLEAIWWCLRSGGVAMDSAEWSGGGRLQLLLGAKRIQLWHGIPLKEIELSLFRKRLESMGWLKQGLLRAYKWIVGRWVRMDLLVATSERTADELFRPAFNARRVAVTGYPRNDVLVQDVEPSPLQLLNTDQDVLMKCRRFRLQGGKVCLYAPTFRQHQRNAFDDGYLDIAALGEFGETNNILFVVKLHPLIEADVPAGLPHVVACAGGSDVYPLLREVDMLCTDYSSVFFDFLLLDRPIIFFVYDLQAYRTSDRALTMDFNEIAPGPLCTTQAQLERAVLAEIENPARYSRDRESLRDYCFDHRDANACERFWSEVRQLLLGPKS